MRLNVLLLFIIIISLFLSIFYFVFFIFKYIDREVYYQSYIITNNEEDLNNVNISIPKHFKRLKNYSTLVLISYLGCVNSILLNTSDCIDSSQIICKKNCIMLKIVGDYDIVYVKNKCIIVKDILSLPYNMCDDIYVSNSKIFPIFVKVMSKNLLCNHESNKIKLDLTELKLDRYLKLNFSVNNFTLKRVTINISGENILYKPPYIYIDKLNLFIHPSFKVTFEGYYENRPYKLFVNISLNKSRIISCSLIYINVFANFRSPINETSINFIDTSSLYIVNFSESINCNGLTFVDCINLIVKKVNSFFKYVSDETLFGVPDYWQFPDEVLIRKMGDCEDWTNLVLSLILRKFPDADCYNCIVLLKNGEYHSFLLCSFEGKLYAFDQQLKGIYNSFSDLKNRKNIKKILYCFNNKNIIYFKNG